MKGLDALASLAPAPERIRLPHKPWPKQQTFIGLGCLEALYGGAAGGGKSDALLHDALKYRSVPGYSAILFRKTYTDLALPDAIMDRAHKWLAGTGARWVDRDKKYLLPTAAEPSSLTFGYLDGPRDRFRYQGAMMQYVGFDELTQFPERDYRYMFSRLRRLKGIDVPLRMRGATNPGDIGHEWVGARFGIVDGYDPDEIQTTEDGRVFVPARLEDNPALGEDYEKSLEQLDEVTYQQLRHGRWIVDASDLVYSFSPRKNIVQELPELPFGDVWSKVFSADFGVTNATAFGVWGFSEHLPAAYLLESDEWTGLSPSESAEIFLQWQNRHGGFDRIVGDLGGLGKGFAEEWRKRFAIPIEPADKQNKLGYIKLMNGDLQHGKALVVRDTNQKFTKCIGALRWKDERHQEEHPGMANHLTDMGLYGWRECRQYQATEAPKRSSDPVERVAAEWRSSIHEADQRWRMQQDEDGWGFTGD